MTEVEWLAAIDPVQMLFAFDHLPATDRQMLLFAVACWTRQLPRLPEQDRQVLATVSAYIEGAASAGDVEAGKDDNAPRYVGHMLEVPSLRLILPRPDEPRFVAECSAASTASLAAIDVGSDGTELHEERVQQVALLRDIFGNPYCKHPKVRKTWLTSTVIALAKQMYESGDFGAMPILADALQDAGCDNDDVLSHCRDAPATHVRGCWALDLVLGKS